MKLSYLIILIGMNFLWAGSLSIYKALAEHLAPGSIVTLRFGVAAVLLMALWPWLPGKAPRGADLVKTVIMGFIVFTLGHRLQVWGTKLSSAGNASVLMAVEPILTSVAAAIFLREYIGPRRWLGFVLGMFGVVLLNGFLRGGFQWAGLWASLIFVSSFFCESVYSIMGKPLIERSGMVKILALALLFGTVVNLVFDGAATLAAVRVMPLRLWWMVLYLAVICTAVGYAIWFVVIKETDVNIVALTVFAQPVAGVLIAWLWLGEALNWGQLWGSLAIVAGLVVGLSRQVKTPAAG
ncbi:MAG TPA: DMT family transporter [Verrucomicrobiae bacterium]|jgi:drug/metabolite transporter (DMT)-like permease|nr:DMT family transporter [Verrucomicrobiae bacterium]